MYRMITDGRVLEFMLNEIRDCPQLPSTQRIGMTAYSEPLTQDASNAARSTFTSTSAKFPIA